MKYGCGFQLGQLSSTLQVFKLLFDFLVFTLTSSDPSTSPVSCNMKAVIIKERGKAALVDIEEQSMRPDYIKIRSVAVAVNPSMKRSTRTIIYSLLAETLQPIFITQLALV